MRKLALAILFCAAAAWAQPVYTPGLRAPCTATRTTGCTPQIDAAGNLSVGNTVLDPAKGVTAPNLIFDSYGRSNLRDWQAQIAKLTNVVAGTTAVVAAFGDSWTSEGNGWIYLPLRNWLWAKFGNAGLGWIACNPHDNPPFTYSTRVIAGTWTNSAKQAGLYGLDASETNSSDIATPGKVTITAIGTDIYVHYKQQPGGGTVSCQSDAGAPQVVSTANATPQFATIAFNGLTNASHALACSVTVAGTAGVTLLGYEFRTTSKGVRFHEIGDSGSQASDFAALNATAWQAGLTALAPNLVIFQWLIDEKDLNTPPATQIAALTTLVGWVRSAAPNASILILTPGDTGSTTTYQTSDYVGPMRDLAVAQGLGFFSSMYSLGTYAEENTRGLMADIHHLNASGGFLVANNLAEYLVGSLSSNSDGQQFASLGINTPPPTSDKAAFNGSIGMIGASMIYDGAAGNTAGWRFDGALLKGYGYNGIDLYSSAVAIGSQTKRLHVANDGGLQWLTAANPTCDATHRGNVNYVAGGAGVKDTFQVCGKDATDAYAWRTIY